MRALLLFAPACEVSAAPVQIHGFSVIVMLVAPRGIAGFVRDRFGGTLFSVAHRAPRCAPRAA